MPFEWQDYLSLAQELSQRQSDDPLYEAALRSAISRAYYAAFCSARDFLRNTDTTIPLTDESHKDVWETYRQKGKNFNAIFVNGSRLKNRRRAADYDYKLRDLEKEIALAFADAKNVFHWLSKAATPTSPN